MSNAGKNPSYKWLNLEPQSVDPTSPNEGDIFRSDGTPRDEGLWVYENAAWVQVSTGATLSVLDNITLTPQSVDPGSPTNGMIFNSDGSSRAAGLWEYNGTGWVQLTGVRYQEFTRKEIIEVRMASTINIVNPLNAIFNGSPAIDGVVPATGDLVLLKNQTTASENGVYIVGATSGATGRDVSADTFEKLNRANVYVGFGTTQRNTQYYQTAVLTSLSDNQVWSTSATSETFVVPDGVTELNIEICAGGGGGGGSRRYISAAGDGGGGAGSVPLFLTRKVNPGDSVDVYVGPGGLPARNRNYATNNGLPADDGGDGESSILTFIDGILTVYGASGGGGGNYTGTKPGAGGVGPSINIVTWAAYSNGGQGATDTTAVNTSGQDSLLASGGVATIGVGRGGGGGAGRLAGADGTVSVTNTNAPCAEAASGAGGAGGNSLTVTDYSFRSGWGGSGYIKLSW